MRKRPEPTWVRHPFHPGYSAVGNVVQVGSGVTSLAEGDAVFTGGKHHQHMVTEAKKVIKLPADMSHENASWSKLSLIAQTAVHRASTPWEIQRWSSAWDHWGSW